MGSALWTFPGLVLSAFLVAWAAEAAQFLISQGLALALLAWLQTLPEFAVEAVIAWEAGKDPTRAHLAIANLTGAIRLLLGLGWPMIYFVTALARRRRGEGGAPWAPITLDAEHAIEVVGLAPPLAYFGFILWKKSFGWVDAVVLLGLYVAYLALLLRHPPREAEEIADAPAVSRWALRLPGWRRPATLALLFATGGALLYFTAHPFLESMLAVAVALGVSQFVFVQWVAPFLSELPEFVSTYTWARRVKPAPLALMNLVSSNINQWTVLAAMIPLVFGLSHWRATGSVSQFHFDDPQRLEILLTLLQTALGVALLSRLAFGWRAAAALLGLWLVQFLLPGTRVEVAVTYGAWLAAVLVGYVVRRETPPAWRAFTRTLAAKTASAGAAEADRPS